MPATKPVTRQRPATDLPGHTSRALLETAAVSIGIQTPSSMAFLLSPDTAFCALSSLATVASVHGGEEDPVFDAPVVREAEDLRALCRRCEMDAVCEECGDVGAKDLLLRCSKCKSAARHRYCLDAVIFDSVVEWLCSDCIPKHNESIKSLEGASNQRQLRNIQFGPSIIKEPNAEKEKVTIAWGLRRNRHGKRKNHVDGSTIHSPSRDTSSQGRNRPHKERGDAVTTQSCSGDALYSCAIFGGDIPNRNDCEKDGKNRNGHLICTVESFDVEKSEPLKAVKGLEESVVASTTFAPNRSKLMQGSHLKTGNADVLKPLKQRLDSCSRVPMQSSPSNELEDTTVQENNPEGTRCLADEETLAPILNNCTSNPSMANERLVSNEGSSAEANRRSDEVLLSTIAKKMERTKSVDREIVNSCKVNGISDPDSAQGDPDASITGATSYLGLKKMILKRVVQDEGINSELLQSSPSNELEDVAVQENSAERTRCLVDEEINAPKMENLKVSKPSMANDCLVSDEGNSDKASRRSNDVSLSTEGNRMPRRMSGDRQIVSFHKVNGISNPESAKVDRDARNLQHNAGQPSSLDVKKAFQKQALQEEAINSELLSSKFVGPCESTKMNPRKRKQSESYTPDEIKYRKASIINEKKNVNAARSKSRRPAPVASLRGCQNMPRKDNGNKDKGIGHSKKEKNKKMDKSWLARKASEGSRKTASDLQPSSLRSSVYKSIPCSENMDLVLKESSCPLNNPRGSCASRVAEISSTTKELRNDSEPKKRKRRRQDAEALHVVDLNSRSCDDDGHVKQQRKCVEKAAKNPRRYVEDEEALRSGNLNQQRSNYYKQVKKQRRIRNLNAGCAENDVSQLALQTGVTEDRSDILRTPLIPESTGVQPLDTPYWTGIMKIDKNFISLSAHLSIKAGKKVQELSRSLPPIMKVTKLSTLKSYPKHLEAPIPSADSIDLYFFCGDTRPNKELDQLVKHVADSGIILEAIVGSAKLRLFPSFVLPEEYQTFQGKPYLWGLFKPRKDEIKRLAPVERDCTSHVTEEEHVQEQHVLDQQDKAHAYTQDQVVHSEKQPLLGASREVRNEALSDNVLPLIDMKAIVSANTSPADHGQPYSNPEARPLKLCGFVVSRTPKSAQLIQEMQKEGALLFAVQQVVTEPGSLV